MGTTFRLIELRELECSQQSSTVLSTFVVPVVASCFLFQTDQPACMYDRSAQFGVHITVARARLVHRQAPGPQNDRQSNSIEIRGPPDSVHRGFL